MLIYPFSTWLRWISTKPLSFISDCRENLKGKRFSVLNWGECVYMYVIWHIKSADTVQSFAAKRMGVTSVTVSGQSACNVTYLKIKGHFVGLYIH